VLGGSIKRNIVNPDLQAERKNTAFDKAEFASFLIGEEVLKEVNEIRAFIEAEPKMQVDLSFFEESRNDQMAIWWRIITTFYNNPAFREKHFIKNSDRKTLRFSWTYLF